MYLITTSEKKVAWNLKESKKGYTEVLEGGKEREKDCNYIVISKIIWKCFF